MKRKFWSSYSEAKILLLAKSPQVSALGFGKLLLLKQSQDHDARTPHTRRCTRACTHAHVHTHMCTRTCIHARAYTHMYTRTCIHAHVHTQMYARTCAHAHVYTHMYTRTCVHAHVHTRMYTRTCAHAHAHAHGPAQLTAIVTMEFKRTLHGRHCSELYNTTYALTKSRT
jgi:hypothetical protein